MNCTNPNCECKPGTFANLNPPTKAPEPTYFEIFMLNGLELQQKVSINTPSGKYRVQIEWELDRYRVIVWYRAAEPEVFFEVRHPLYAHTAVVTANRLLREYDKRS
jgi:hypothetical protein